MTVPFFLFQSSPSRVAFNTSTGYLGPRQPSIQLEQYTHGSMKETGLRAIFARVRGRDMYSREMKTERDADKDNPGSREHLVAKQRRDGNWDVFRVVHVDNPPENYFMHDTFYYQEAYGVKKADADEAIRLFNATGEVKPRRSIMGQRPLSREYPGISYIKNSGLAPG